MSKAKFAVFDIDGTLIRWQLYHAVVDRLAKKDLLQPDSLKRMRDARMIWKRRESIDAFSKYEQELISIYDEALPRLKAKDFDETAAEIASEYKEQVYRYTRGLAEKLKSEGYKLLAISGSHEELVGHVARQFNFDDWVGTQYERTADGFTGKRFFAAKDKNIILDKLVRKHNLTYEDSFAVGDSKSDAALLKAVENPIAFNPDKDLFNIASDKGWKIVVERKNMIYCLEQKNGRYQLATTN